MQSPVWNKCLERLEEELSAQQFNTWLRPLHAVQDNQMLRLLAPNRFVVDWVRERFLERIAELSSEYSGGVLSVQVEVGSQSRLAAGVSNVASARVEVGTTPKAPSIIGRMNQDFTFETHVEGKSNQLARAAARQVGENPGGAYNPLFIYGGV